MMEALSGCAWRQGLAHATMRREAGSLSCSQGPSIALCGRGRVHVSERMQATSSDAELDTMANPGSLVQQTLGNRIEPFSRPTQILSSQEVVDALYAGLHNNAVSNYMAFYSSELGGIVTDPALMVVSLDDHMVHRGHAVFDTATLTQGYLYQLDDHLDRFYRSAEKAGLSPPFPRNQLRRIILETAAATQSFEGSIRYWCSAGRGGFGISPLECLQTSFYCIAYKNPDPADPRQGWKVKTSPVPIKDPYFATLKSTNYLANALVALDAQLEGFDQGVFVDSDGYVAEGPVMNIGIITHEGELVVPPFEQTLAGVTLQRLLHLVGQVLQSGDTDVLGFIKKISQRKFKLEEAKQAKEVFMVGSSTVVMPVIQWDDTEFLQTKPTPEVGIIALSLRALLEEDMDPTGNRGQHVEVPYGFLTGA